MCKKNYYFTVLSCKSISLSEHNHGFENSNLSLVLQYIFNILSVIVCILCALPVKTLDTQTEVWKLCCDQNGIETRYTLSLKMCLLYSSAPS